MKKISAYIIIGLLPFAQVQADNNEQRIQDSRAAIKSLAGELQNTLQASMKAKGPIESISVCRDEAPAIAGRVSEEKVLTVGRTSLKVRNQANKADAWEKEYLEVSVGNARAMILRGLDNNNAYLYLQSDDAEFSAISLHYEQAGVWKTVHDNAFPFEFTVPLHRADTKFTFYLEGTTVDGNVIRSKEEVLQREDQ